jgi:hypothetical protein
MSREPIITGMANESERSEFGVQMKALAIVPLKQSDDEEDEL